VTEKGSRVVSVEIHGQRYPIRSSLDPAYVAELASYVDEKMRTAAAETASGDSLKIAVVAALNIADEYFRSLREEGGPAGRILERAGRIEALVDRVLTLGLRESD
jgi:cell division protein ZapA